MRPDDIIELLRARPFESFRLHMSDDAAYEVRHPELAIVGRSTVVVGVPGPEGLAGPVERTVNCALVHITRTELVDGTASSR